VGVPPAGSGHSSSTPRPDGLGHTASVPDAVIREFDAAILALSEGKCSARKQFAIDWLMTVRGRVSRLLEQDRRTVEAKIAALPVERRLKVLRRFIEIASAIEAGTAKTEGLGPKDESAVPKGDAQ
jgi:hypothetical protein